MINLVALTGRLTKEPELKYTPSGIAVCRFTLAVNRSFAKDDQPKADFINILVWRKSAENAAKFLKKGSLTGIEGRIQTGSYEGQNGKRVYTTEIVAEKVQFLESNNQNQQPQQQQSNGTNQQYQQQHSNNGNYPPASNTYQQPQQVTPYNNNQGWSVSDDDLPF